MNISNDGEVITRPKLLFPHPWTENYKTPTFFVEGMRVYVTVSINNEMKGMPFRIVFAAGDLARGVNEKYGLEWWIELQECCVRKEEQPDVRT